MVELDRRSRKKRRLNGNNAIRRNVTWYCHFIFHSIGIVVVSICSIICYFFTEFLPHLSFDERDLPANESLFINDSISGNFVSRLVISLL